MAFQREINNIQVHAGRRFAFERAAFEERQLATVARGCSTSGATCNVGDDWQHCRRTGIVRHRETTVIDGGRHGTARRRSNRH